MVCRSAFNVYRFAGNSGEELMYYLEENAPDTLCSPWHLNAPENYSVAS